MRKPKKVQGQSLGAAAIQRVGFMKARQAVSFTAQWWIVTASIGRPPETVDEYSDWWAMSRATGFRMQSSFRLAYPGFDTPTQLAEAIGYDVPSLKRQDESRLTVQLFQWAAP